MEKEKKFKSPVQFESFDQGGTFDPIKVPDLKPYLDANKAVEQRDMETHKKLGLADLQLEQDRTKGVEAYNAVVQRHIAESGLSRAKHLSKSLETIVSAGLQIKDHHDQKNALVDFNKALMNNEIAPVNAIIEYSQLTDEAKKNDDIVQALAGKHWQLRDLDVDNIHRILSLSPWKQGHYRMRLLLKHYAGQVPDFLASRSQTKIPLPQFDGQEFSLSDQESWPKGHAAPIRAYLENANIANLVGMFAGFPEEAVGQIITPAIAAYQKSNVIDFNDKQTSQIEGSVFKDIQSAVEVEYRSHDPKGLYTAVQEQFAFAAKWMSPADAKKAVFGVLLADAKKGLVSGERIDDMLDQIHQGKQTYREFLGERFLAEYDLEGEANKAANKKEEARLEGHAAVKNRAKADIFDAVNDYKRDNNGAFPPKEVITNIIEKYENEFGLDGSELANGVLHAENKDDRTVIETLDYIRIKQGGKLTADQLRGASFGVQKHFHDQGLVNESALMPKKALVTNSVALLQGVINDKIPSLGDWDIGEKKAYVIQRSEEVYKALYQENLDGGMPHHKADQQARLDVKGMIEADAFQIPDKQEGSSATQKYRSVGAQFKASGFDPTKRLEALAPDVEAMVKTYETSGRLEIPYSLRQFAQLAKITSAEAAVYQSGGRIKIPNIELEVNKAMGVKNNDFTKNNRTNYTAGRAITTHPGVVAKMQNPIYTGGEFDARDSRRLPTKVNVESMTIGEAFAQLNSGQLKTITGFEFTGPELSDILNRSGLSPDTKMTPDIQEQLYLYKLYPSGTERDSSGHFLWRPG